VKGDSGAFAEPIKYLLDQQKDRVGRKLTGEQNQHISIGAHRTRYNEFEGRSGIVAHKLLSEYAYKNFFLVSLKRLSRMQHRDLEDGAVVVWSSNVTNPLLTEEEN
jgi:hypothetical protein